MIIVSILVLLDRALQHYTNYCISIRNASFNPCFTGSCTSTRPDRRSIRVLRHVSILVLLDRALQQLFSLKRPIYLDFTLFLTGFFGDIFCKKTAKNELKRTFFFHQHHLQTQLFQCFEVIALNFLNNFLITKVFLLKDSLNTVSSIINLPYFSMNFNNINRTLSSKWKH